MLLPVVAVVVAGGGGGGVVVGGIRARLPNMAGGGGIVVLEELEYAKARGAKIYAEVVGYGANSDG